MTRLLRALYRAIIEENPPVVIINGRSRTIGDLVGNDLIIDLEIAYLAVHLMDSRLIDCWILPDLRIAQPDLMTGVLHIWHVDIDYTVQQAQSCQRVVTTSIVYQRQPQSSLRGYQHACKDLAYDVAG